MRVFTPSRFLVYILFIFSFNANAIVNTEGTIQSFNKQGLNGKLGLAFKGSSGNNKSSQLAFDGAISWLNSDSKTVLLMGRDFGKSNEIKNVDNSFIYLKHIRQNDSRFAFSTFAQHAQDSFRKIKSRQLLGLGARIDINKHSLVELSLMREKIDSTAEDTRSINATRLNLMWHFDMAIDEEISLKNTLYYQPNVEEFSDKQAINHANLVFKINKNLSVSIYHKMSHYSEPLENAKSTDNHYGTKFSYSF